MDQLTEMKYLKNTLRRIPNEIINNCWRSSRLVWSSPEIQEIKDVSEDFDKE